MRFRGLAASWSVKKRQRRKMVLEKLGVSIVNGGLGSLVWLILAVRLEFCSISPEGSRALVWE